VGIVADVLAKTDLAELIEQTYELESDGPRYWRAREHDSLVIDERKQRWYWNSRDLGGDALDWLTEVCNLTFKDALNRLRLREGATARLARLPVSEPKPKNMTMEALQYHQALISHKGRALTLQRQRSLRLATILRARLGWYEDGMIAGYTIPHWTEPPPSHRPLKWQVCLGIKLRCVQGPKRYRALPGSRFGLYTPANLATAPMVFIVEGEFKALHILQLGGVAVSCTCKCFTPDKAEKLSQLRQTAIFCVRDNDLGGLEFVGAVRQYLPQVILLAPAPGFKGVDDWVIAKRIQSLDELITKGLAHV